MSIPSSPTRIGPSDPQLLFMGRTQKMREGQMRVGYPGVTLRFAFEGTEAVLFASCNTGNCILLPFVDGDRRPPIRLSQGPNELLLAKQLPPGRHLIELVRQTETWLGIMTLEGITLPGGRLVDAQPWPQRRLLFIGDSVTSGEAAGRGADCSTDQALTWDAAGSYGMLLGKTLGAQVHLVSFGGRGLVRDWQGKRDVLNAPQFFELAVPEVPNRDDAPLGWDHQNYVPDAIVVSLGTNDFNLSLGAFPSEQDFVGTYVTFLKRLRSVHPHALIFITEGALVKDSPKSTQRTTLRRYLEQTVVELRDERATHVPAKHYPGDGCNAHPTGAQHQQMAQDLAPILRQALAW